MLSLLPDLPLLMAFLGASFLLAVTPGPGVLYIVARSLVQGRRSGLASVAGVAVGNMGNAIGASLGLAALFAVSSLAFTLVKYAGAAYLIYLGIRALRDTDTSTPSEAPQTRNHGKVFKDGVVVSLMNPKTTLFFAAFLPQFMNPEASYIAQSLLLGALFVWVAALTDCVYALAAGTLGKRVVRGDCRGDCRAIGMQRTGRYLSGSIFIGLGLFTALTGTRPAVQTSNQ